MDTAIGSFPASPGAQPRVKGDLKDLNRNLFTEPRVQGPSLRPRLGELQGCRRELVAILQLHPQGKGALGATSSMEGYFFSFCPTSKS